MGITFRSDGYIKHVNFGGRTIKDGEAVAIWNSQGVHTQIIGPKRIWLINSTIRFLTRYKAESHQYIKVSYVDGRVDHVIGPAVLYHNPAYHDKVEVKDGYHLNSDSECIVAFRNQVTKDHDNKDPEKKAPSTSSSSKSSIIINNNGTAVTKRIIHGPTLFIPQPNEHVHLFSWSDYSSFNFGDTKNCDKTKFHILQCQGMTTTFPLTIPTNDGYSFDINLKLSYSISSIDKLLSVSTTTNSNFANCTRGSNHVNNDDPIKALYTSLLFDAQSQIGRSISSEDLQYKKSDIVHKLSSSSNDNKNDGVTNTYFPSLYKTSTTYGININSIHITSLELCQTLQTIINNKTLLSNSLNDNLLQMKSNTELNEIQNKNESRQLQEKIKLKREEIILNNELSRESYQMKVEELERELMLDKKEIEGRIAIEKIKEDAVVDMLCRLKNEMDVDMTKLLTSGGEDRGYGIDAMQKIMEKSNVLGKKKN